MKKYTITIDEKQMELVRVALESQAEVARDVATAAYQDFKDRQTYENWVEYLKCSAEFHMATEICKMLKCAKGCDEAEQNNDPGNCTKSGIRGDVIHSEEFATEIDDYVSNELQNCLEGIADHLYKAGYMKVEPSYGDFDDNETEIRDAFVGFLQDWYGLAESDGANF